MIDLHARSIELCRQLGEEKTRAFNPAKADGTPDTTHLDAQGSVVFARLVIDDLVGAVPELKIAFRNQVASAPAGPSGTTFDVRQYGAKGDGKTIDTAAIQKALDECDAAGGGIVQLPAGTYLCQPITLRSKTTLQLDEGATLQATTEHKDFMKTPGDWLQAKSGSDFVPFITGKNLTDVTITGQGHDRRRRTGLVGRRRGGSPQDAGVHAAPSESDRADRLQERESHGRHDPELRRSSTSCPPIAKTC